MGRCRLGARVGPYPNNNTKEDKRETFSLPYHKRKKRPRRRKYRSSKLILRGFVRACGCRRDRYYAAKAQLPRIGVACGRREPNRGAAPSVFM